MIKYKLPDIILDGYTMQTAEGSVTKVGTYIQGIMVKNNLTVEEIETAMDTVEAIDLDKLVMDAYPVLREKRWMLQLLYHNVRTRMNALDEYDAYMEELKEKTYE